MAICKNCGSLPSEEFTVRASGYVPNVCRACERLSAANRRKAAYADGTKRDIIRKQNMLWRAKNAEKLAAKAQSRYVHRLGHCIVDTFNADWANQFTTDGELLAWARRGGFLPSTELTSDIFQYLRKIEIRDPLPQSYVGLNYLDNVNPHRYEASTEDKLSVKQAFEDDSEIIKVIKYILSTNRTPTRELILRNMKFNAVMPAHFCPSAAVALVNAYASGGSVLDPFLGWGGRILGTLCSNAKSFTGTDLQRLSVSGAFRIQQDFACLSSVSSTSICADFSDFMLSTNQRFDLIMASPPFFDTENYGIAGKRGKDWITSVARPLVAGASRVLNTNGTVAIHAQDRPKMAVLSIIMASFLGAGFEIMREYKYGRKPGQYVLIFSRHL